MLDTINAPEISQAYRDQGKELINKLSTGKINTDQFELEVAYMAIDTGFDELHKKPYPSMPVVIKAYREASIFEQEKLRTNPDFWKRPEVFAFMQGCKSVDSHNNMCKWWLDELAKRFEKAGDMGNHYKVKKRLQGFA